MKTAAIAFWGILVIIFAAGSSPADERPVVCITCHAFMGGDLARPVKEWSNSIHRQNGITCDLCHGGSANISVGNIAKLSGRDFADLQSLAMSKAKGFVGKPSGKALFAMCAKCHADSVDRYRSSIMGKAYLGGTGGPSCVVCHNAHDNIIPPVPKVCEGCHQDTSGFDRIDPMNVTAATINELSRIRIRLAEERTKGAKPQLMSNIPEDLDPAVIGILAFGGVTVLFLIGWIIYLALERRS